MAQQLFLHIVSWEIWYLRWFLSISYLVLPHPVGSRQHHQQWLDDDLPIILSPLQQSTISSPHFVHPQYRHHLKLQKGGSCSTQPLKVSNLLATQVYLGSDFWFCSYITPRLLADWPWPIRGCSTRAQRNPRKYKYLSNCWHDISNINVNLNWYTSPHTQGPKGQKKPNKIQISLQLLAWYIQYQC